MTTYLLPIIYLMYCIFRGTHFGPTLRIVLLGTQFDKTRVVLLVVDNKDISNQTHVQV